MQLMGGGGGGDLSSMASGFGDGGGGGGDTGGGGSPGGDVASIGDPGMGGGDPSGMGGGSGGGFDPGAGVPSAQAPFTPSNVVGGANDPVNQAQQQANLNPPPTSSPTGTQSAPQKPSWLDEVGKFMFGDAHAATPPQAGGPATGDTSAPTATTGLGGQQTAETQLPQIEVKPPLASQPQMTRPQPGRGFSPPSLRPQPTIGRPAPAAPGDPAAGGVPLPTPRPSLGLPTTDTGDVGQQGGVAAHEAPPGSPATAPFPGQGSSFPGLAELASGQQQPGLDRTARAAIATAPPDPSSLNQMVEALSRGQGFGGGQSPPWSTVPPTVVGNKGDALAMANPPLPPPRPATAPARPAPAEQPVSVDQPKSVRTVPVPVPSAPVKPPPGALSPDLTKPPPTKPAETPKTPTKATKTPAAEREKTPEEYAKDALDRERAKRAAPAEPAAQGGHWEPSGGPGGMGQNTPRWVPDTPAAAAPAAPAAAAPVSRETAAPAAAAASGVSPFINEPPLLRRIIDMLTGNQGDLAAMAREAQQYQGKPWVPSYGPSTGVFSRRPDDTRTVEEVTAPRATAPEKPQSPPEPGEKKAPTETKPQEFASNRLANASGLTSKIPFRPTVQTEQVTSPPELSKFIRSEAGRASRFSPEALPWAGAEGKIDPFTAGAPARAPLRAQQPNFLENIRPSTPLSPRSELLDQLRRQSFMSPNQRMYTPGDSPRNIPPTYPPPVERGTQVASADRATAFDSVTMTDPKTGKPWKSRPAAPTVPQAFPDWDEFFNQLTADEAARPANPEIARRWPQEGAFEPSPPPAARPGAAEAAIIGWLRQLLTTPAQ